MEIPPIMYGTAWKEEHTEEFTSRALQTGFRGIDTANQRKHYVEAAVGKAIKSFLESVPRTKLFIQTKFTSLHGQDHRIPYDLKADYPLQVKQSVQSSLQNLKVSYIDSYILHGPLTGFGLIDDDWKIWRAMENSCKSGHVKKIGVSNVNINQLKELFSQADIKPRFVQNRCYASQRWDKEIRDFCSKNNIIYQGFSLLTANSQVLTDHKIKQIAQTNQITPAQLIFSFAREIGMVPLTGTSNTLHMQQDLVHKKISKEEIEFIENISK